MLRGIAWALGVILVIGGCWWLYNHAKDREVSTSGDVFLHAPPADSKDSQDTQESKTPTDIDGNPLPPNTTPTQPTPQTPAQQSATTNAPNAPLPVSDTVAPNPPNGMVFAGTGKYQWYRQGNLTWRVNTENGTSCIAFATDEEWRKPRVYSHGCGNA